MPTGPVHTKHLAHTGWWCMWCQTHGVGVNTFDAKSLSRSSITRSDAGPCSHPGAAFVVSGHTFRVYCTRKSDTIRTIPRVLLVRVQVIYILGWVPWAQWVAPHRTRVCRVAAARRAICNSRRNRTTYVTLHAYNIYYNICMLPAHRRNAS